MTEVDFKQVRKNMEELVLNIIDYSNHYVFQSRRISNRIIESLPIPPLKQRIKHLAPYNEIEARITLDITFLWFKKDEFKIEGNISYFLEHVVALKHNSSILRRENYKLLQEIKTFNSCMINEWLRRDLIEKIRLALLCLSNVHFDTVEIILQLKKKYPSILIPKGSIDDEIL